MARITLTLEISEKSALIKMAEREMRDPRAQAVLIIRKELQQNGLLPAVVSTRSTTLQARELGRP